MLEIVNALTVEDWHRFKVMKEQRTRLSELARRSWRDQENFEEIHCNGEASEIE